MPMPSPPPPPPPPPPISLKPATDTYSSLNDNNNIGTVTIVRTRSSIGEEKTTTNNTDPEDHLHGSSNKNDNNINKYEYQEEDNIEYMEEGVIGSESLIHAVERHAHDNNHNNKEEEETYHSPTKSPKASFTTSSTSPKSAITGDTSFSSPSSTVSSSTPTTPMTPSPPPPPSSSSSSSKQRYSFLKLANYSSINDDDEDENHDNNKHQHNHNPSPKTKKPNKKKKKKKNSPKKNKMLSSLRRTFSSSSSSGHTSLLQNNDDNEKDYELDLEEIISASEEDEEEEEEEEDPLIALFHVHNTQRVKFDLSRNMTRDVDKNRTVVEDTMHNNSGSSAGGDRGDLCSSTSSAVGIKKFARKTLFGSNSNSTSTSANASSAMGNGKKGVTIAATTTTIPANNTTENELDYYNAYFGNDPSSPSSSHNTAPVPAIRNNSSFASSKQTYEKEDYYTYPHTESTSDADFNSDPKIQSKIQKLLYKANKAHKVTFKYEQAMRYYLLAMSILTKAHYPDSHPLTTTTLKALNDTHHAQSSLSNSANIVKMGIKHENCGDFIKALKMYTIAYRIRRDALGPNHPSLPVLLNMLGSAQLKRGEMVEAMQIYEMALKGRPDDVPQDGQEEDDDAAKKTRVHPLTMSVTLRDMGLIHERSGKENDALRLYHESLETAVKGMKKRKTKSSSAIGKSRSGGGGGGGKNRKKQEKGKKIRRRRDREKNNQSPSSGDGNHLETDMAEASEARQGGTVEEAKRNGDNHNSADEGTTPTSYKNEEEIRNEHETSSTKEQQRLCSLSGVRLVKSSSNNNNIAHPSSSSSRKQSNRQREEEHPLKRNLLNMSPKSENIKSKGDESKNNTTYEEEYEGNECGEMEVYFDCHHNYTSTKSINSSQEGERASESHHHSIPASFYYDTIFVSSSSSFQGNSRSNQKKSSSSSFQSANTAGGADVDVSMTLHHIAQIYRRRCQHEASLSAYYASLRGMRRALGDTHPNVAAILGNVGNLHKEMGEYDRAYEIYQEVLSIESHHLGVSHPEVAVTLHNIATIESSRGHCEEAVSLYRQVVQLQRTLFGPNHMSVAVTSSCMASVFEKMGDTKRAMNAYEATLKVRTILLGRHHVDVGRLLHKLGSLAFRRDDFRLADAYLSRATKIYKFNKLEDDHPWVKDIARDEADIKAKLSLGRQYGEDYAEC